MIKKHPRPKDRIIQYDTFDAQPNHYQNLNYTKITLFPNEKSKLFGILDIEFIIQRDLSNCGRISLHRINVSPLPKVNFSRFYTKEGFLKKSLLDYVFKAIREFLSEPFGVLMDINVVAPRGIRTWRSGVTVSGNSSSKVVLFAKWLSIKYPKDVILSPFTWKNCNSGNIIYEATILTPCDKVVREAIWKDIR